MNDPKKKRNLYLQQKQTLSHFVHTSGGLMQSLAQMQSHFPSTLRFPRLGGKAEPQKSKYRGVRYIPPTLHRHQTCCSCLMRGRLVHRVEKHHTLNLRQPPLSAEIGGKRGGVAQNYTDKPPIHRWNLQTTKDKENGKRRKCTK